jgi:hypothetical protein
MGRAISSAVEGVGRAVGDAADVAGRAVGNAADVAGRTAAGAAGAVAGAAQAGAQAISTGAASVAKGVSALTSVGIAAAQSSFEMAGAAAQAGMKAGMAAGMGPLGYLPSPGQFFGELNKTATDIRDKCLDLHNKIMDPVLDIQKGIGGVLKTIQGMLVDTKNQGQQALGGMIKGASEQYKQGEQAVAGVVKQVAEGVQQGVGIAMKQVEKQLKEGEQTLGGIEEKIKGVLGEIDGLEREKTVENQKTLQEIMQNMDQTLSEYMQKQKDLSTGVFKQLKV